MRCQMELLFNANYYCSIQSVRIDFYISAIFIFKTKFARERPMIEDKIAEIEKNPCKVMNAVNLV